MAGGGIWRTDQVQLAFAEEVVDGLAPGTVDQSFGIVKGGVVLPDVEYSWDYYFGVGRDSRSRIEAHEGNQAFRGSIPQIYVTHNATRRLLELALGEFTDAVQSTSTFTAIADGTATDGGGVDFTSPDVQDGTYAVFSGPSVGYIDNSANTTILTVFPTPDRGAAGGPGGWNGPRPDIGDVYEIRQTEGSVLSLTPAAGDKFIVPTQNLNTVTWAVNLRNASRHGATKVGSNMIINYLGGKVNRATLSARMGEKLMLSLDEVLFRDLLHDVDIPSSSVPKYDASPTAPTATFPFEEPLVFSRGTISMFTLANTFARIQSFSLSIDNQLTEQRYISKVSIDGGASSAVAQIPFELIEGNRLITLDIEAVLETREWWEYLMRQGLNEGLSAKTGFDFQLTFDGQVSGETFNIQGPASLLLTHVADIDGSTAQASATNIGCVIESAPHSIPGPDQSLITVPMKISVPDIVFRWEDV